MSARLQRQEPSFSSPKFDSPEKLSKLGEGVDAQLNTEPQPVFSPDSNSTPEPNADPFVTAKGSTGTVIFYSKEKGYGFVKSDDNEDFYFSFKALASAWIPEAGDRVTFEISKHKPKEGQKRSLRSLDRTGEVNVAALKNGRVKCPHCKEIVYPRPYIYQGAILYNLCPSCGKIVKDFREESHSMVMDNCVRIVAAGGLPVFMGGLSAAICYVIYCFFSDFVSLTENQFGMMRALVILLWLVLTTFLSFLTIAYSFQEDSSVQNQNSE